MDDVLGFDVFAHEDGLFLDFGLGIGELEVVTSVDFRDVFGDAVVVFLEGLFDGKVNVDHEDDDVSGKFREHVIEVGDWFPLHHPDRLVVYSLAWQVDFLNFYGSCKQLLHRQV